MFISEMAKDECYTVLAQSQFGRLACARDEQPYIVPFYFVRHETHLYSCSTLGQKIEWMRLNPRVCVEMDEVISSVEWTSVVVFGRYEELADRPEHKSLRERAYELLQQRAMWWQPALVATTTHRGLPHSFPPVFFRVHIDEISGHRAKPDPLESVARPAPVPKNESWWGKVFRRLQTKRLTNQRF